MCRTVLIYGFPHAGKSSIAAAVTRRIDAARFDVGEILRQTIADGPGHPGYELARKVLSSNQLLSDVEAARLLSTKIKGCEAKDIVLVGFPRTEDSLTIFEKCMRRMGRPIALCCVINIQMDELLSKELTLKRSRAGDADPSLIDSRYDMFKRNDVYVIGRLKSKVRMLEIQYTNGLSENIEKVLRFIG